MLETNGDADCRTERRYEGDDISAALGGDWRTLCLFTRKSMCFGSEQTIYCRITLKEKVKESDIILRSWGRPNQRKKWNEMRQNESGYWTFIHRVDTNKSPANVALCKQTTICPAKKVSYWSIHHPNLKNTLLPALELDIQHSPVELSCRKTGQGRCKLSLPFWLF